MNQQIYYLPAPFMGFGVVERHLDPLTPAINENAIRTFLYLIILKLAILEETDVHHHLLQNNFTSNPLI